MSEHYEFTTQDMLHTFTTHVQGGSEADFFIWLTAHEEQIRQEERENITAAEQRGAERVLRETADHIAATDHYMIDGDKYTPCSSCKSIHYQYLDYRADQMEGDDAVIDDDTSS